MKKTVIVLVSMLAFLLGACLPGGLTPAPPTGPTVDSAATSDALFRTAVAQTLTAQPMPTSAFLTDPATGPVESPVGSTTDTATLPVTETPASTQDSTPIVNLTTTPVTATNLPANGSITATLAVGQVTASPTLGIRTYGTLPPAVPYSQITLINKANAEAYISLQVTMPDGKYSIIEYPVEGTIKIQAPVGSYLYVTWVGGRKMVGEFRLHHSDDLSITLFRDRVVIK
ncbi:MAG TPA: hypothetical protein VMN99_08350 [Anaerolineales bacterium]|nr:hypothetical protein [Anaerolineales bacterium]